jgi:hypothetical protein
MQYNQLNSVTNCVIEIDKLRDYALWNLLSIARTKRRVVNIKPLEILPYHAITQKRCLNLHATCSGDGSLRSAHDKLNESGQALEKSKGGTKNGK